MKLYIDVAESVGKYIYFTAINSNGLYRMYSGKIELITLLYEQWDYQRKYTGLVHYQGKLWIFPWIGNKIWIYDIDCDKLDNIQLPLKYIDEKDGSTRLRKPIVEDNMVWLIAANTNEVLNINMDTYEAKGYSNWPEKIGAVEKNCFKSGFIRGNLLYLLKDKAMKSAILNINTWQSMGLDLQEGYMFGMNFENAIYYIPTTCKGNIIKEGDKKEEIIVPDYYWGEAKPYQYWYGVNVEDKLVILPHDAGSIILVQKELITFIDTRFLRITTLNDDKHFSAYHAFSYMGQLIIVPYEGDEFWMVNSNGQIIKMGKLLTNDKCDEVTAFINWGVTYSGQVYKEEYSDGNGFHLYKVYKNDENLYL